MGVRYPLFSENGCQLVDFICKMIWQADFFGTLSEGVNQRDLLAILTVSIPPSVRTGEFWFAVYVRAEAALFFKKLTQT